MGKKSIIFIFVIIIFVFSEWGNFILPLSLEISDVEVTGLVGMDTDNLSQCSVSVVLRRSKGDEAGKGNKTDAERLVTVKAESFMADIKGLQNYEEKIFIGSHVRDIVIGDELARNNMTIWLDFVAKDSDVRSNTNIYIAKDMEASKLFNETLENENGISNRIYNIVKDSKFDTEKRKVKLLDVIDMFLTGNRVGVIPCIMTVTGGEKRDSDYIIERKPDNEISRIELAGYGIISEGKLIGYLNNDETDGYDYVSNLIKEDAITVKINEEEYGINLISAKTDLDFEFSGDNLSKIIIKTRTKNFMGENSKGKNVFAHNINEIEKLESEFIANKIRTVIDRCQSEKIDFMDIGKKLEFKHPYKWRKIKDKWQEIFPNIDVEIEVNSKIDRSYDILSTNED